ncbi:MAG: hypothetical protein EXS05_14470 [Planctomycetaceae bacterium]|nr:hypothetical protein [Planctomycetaceae bacterium]
MSGPLLAANNNWDTIFAVVVMVFWVVGWIIKMIAGKSKNVPPVVNRPRNAVRPRDEKLQDEIDIFLQETGSGRGAGRPAAGRPAAARPPVAARQPAPRSPAPRAPVPPRPVVATRPPDQGLARPGRAETARPAPGQRLASPVGRRERPGEEIAARHVPAATNLGSGVQQHVRQHMAERVTREAEVFIKSGVEQSVSQHLGQVAMPASTTQAQVAAATPVSRETIAALLLNAGNLRQAMVASLILGPPPGRKPRRP